MSTRLRRLSVVPPCSPHPLRRTCPALSSIRDTACSRRARVPVGELGYHSRPGWGRPSPPSLTRQNATPPCAALCVLSLNPTSHCARPPKPSHCPLGWFNGAQTLQYFPPRQGTFLPLPALRTWLGSEDIILSFFILYEDLPASTATPSGHRPLPYCPCQMPPAPGTEHLAILWVSLAPLSAS